jgi:hypothetical protein
MDQAFLFDRIQVTLVSTTDEVLMNGARYQVRVIQSRTVSGSVAAPMMQNITRFSLILAHATATQRFPFALPDPLAHPETIGLVWDVYLAGDTALWSQLWTALDLSASVTSQTQDKLQQATEELQTLSEHHRSPFKPKQTAKR